MSVEERKKITDFMAHDTETADRYYAYNPSAQETTDIRRLMQQALHGPQPEASIEELKGLVDEAVQEGIAEGEAIETVWEEVQNQAS